MPKSKINAIHKSNVARTFPLVTGGLTAGLSSSDEESDDPSLDSSFFDFLLLSRCAFRRIGIDDFKNKNAMSTYPGKDLFGRNWCSMLCTGYCRSSFFGVNNLFANFSLGSCFGLCISLFFNLLVGFGHRRRQKTRRTLEVEPDLQKFGQATQKRHITSAQIETRPQCLSAACMFAFPTVKND